MKSDWEKWMDICDTMTDGAVTGAGAAGGAIIGNAGCGPVCGGALGGLTGTAAHNAYPHVMQALAEIMEGPSAVSLSYQDQAPEPADAGVPAGIDENAYAQENYGYEVEDHNDSHDPGFGQNQEACYDPGWLGYEPGSLNGEGYEPGGDDGGGS